MHLSNTYIIACIVVSEYYHYFTRMKEDRVRDFDYLGSSNELRWKTMTVSHPNQQVCLLRKAISIPLGHGTGSLGKGELVTVINSQGDDCTISLLMDSSQVYTCHEKNLKLVRTIRIVGLLNCSLNWVLGVLLSFKLHFNIYEGN